MYTEMNYDIGFSFRFSLLTFFYYIPPVPFNFFFACLLATSFYCDSYLFFLAKISSLSCHGQSRLEKWANAFEDTKQDISLHTRNSMDGVKRGF